MVCDAVRGGLHRFFIDVHMVFVVLLNCTGNVVQRFMPTAAWTVTRKRPHSMSILVEATLEAGAIPARWH